MTLSDEHARNEENENLIKLKRDVVDTLSETRISKEENTKNLEKLHKIGKTDKNNTHNTMLKFKSHSFKEKTYFKGMSNRHYLKILIWAYNFKINRMTRSFIFR